MPITVNLRHLEQKNVQLEGDLFPAELELEGFDELIQVRAPLAYDLEIERNGPNLLVRGSLRLPLRCECVRCLKPFDQVLNLDAYQLEIPLEGEDKAPVENDLVDLTPPVREDIMLAFPRHPVCEAGCDRMPELKASGPLTAPVGEQSAWDELNKLKL